MNNIVPPDLGLDQAGVERDDKSPVTLTKHQQWGRPVFLQAAPITALPDPTR